jgi:hypothetical protein
MNTTQIGSIHAQAAVDEPTPQEPVSEEPTPAAADMLVTVRVIWLKPERIQDAFTLDLTLRERQPVTIELAQPQVSITLHGGLLEEARPAA